MENEMFNNV